MRVEESRRARGVTPRAAWAELAERVSENRLRELVTAMSVPRSFFSELAENQRIASWIADELSSPQRPLGGIEGGGPQLDIRFQGRYANVVATTRAAAERPSVLIGAHYDSVPKCPGADDNASAVAAMMHCAELLVRHDPALPLAFVAFNCEEDGLLGSADFVDSFLPESPLRVRMAHVLEMVGYSDPRPGSQKLPHGLPVRLPDAGDFLGLLANGGSRREASRVLRLAASYLPDFPVLSLKVYFNLERRIPVLLRSDHASFWHGGVPSLLWTDTSEFRNARDHRRTDTPDTLD